MSNTNGANGAPRLAVSVSPDPCGAWVYLCTPDRVEYPFDYIHGEGQAALDAANEVAVKIRAVLEAEAARVAAAATKAERERCARTCEAMVTGGRAWDHDQEVAGKALLAAAGNIRAGAPVEG